MTSGRIRRSFFDELNVLGLLPLLRVAWVTASGSGTEYLVRTDEECFSQSLVYKPLWFELVLPPQSENETAQLRFQIDNTDRRITQVLRQTIQPAVITMDLAVIPDPIERDGSARPILDEIEQTLTGEIRLMTSTIEVLEFETEIYADLKEEPWPVQRYRAEDGFLVVER